MQFRDTEPVGAPAASLLEVGAAAAEEAEKRAAMVALEGTNWNRKAAAKRLNVSYKTLLNKLNKWELGQEDGGDDPDNSSESPGRSQRYLL